MGTDRAMGLTRAICTKATRTSHCKSSQHLKVSALAREALLSQVARTRLLCSRLHSACQPPGVQAQQPRAVFAAIYQLH
eukprot:6677046-Pyramimonas_sp.AAC.2